MAIAYHPYEVKFSNGLKVTLDLAENSSYHIGVQPDPKTGRLQVIAMPYAINPAEENPPVVVKSLEDGE